MTAIAMCARVDTDDLVKLKDDAQQMPCRACGAMLWVSPTTLAIPDVMLFCNSCGREAAAMAQAVSGDVRYRIAPGALRDPTPDDRRRRNELEAHGFSDITEDEWRDLTDL